MLLAIDVGNTSTVFALHDGETTLMEWRCRTERARTADEYFVWLQQLMENAGLATAVRSVVIVTMERMTLRSIWVSARPSSVPAKPTSRLV